MKVTILLTLDHSPLKLTLTRIPTGWLAKQPYGYSTLINIENVKFIDTTITLQFDALKYIASYPDLIAVFGTNEKAAETHYITSGFYEGRSTAFDALKYIASYPDLIAVFGTNERAAEAHYITSGFYEGRSAVFDALKYIASYPDLVVAFGSDERAAVTHYITSGFYEGRIIASSDPIYNLVNVINLIGTFSAVAFDSYAPT